MSQINIKRKACDIRTWKKRLFLDISSTNIDILVPSLYQCVETRSRELSHFHTSFSTSSAEYLPPRWFLADQTCGSHWGPSPGCKADV
jgi:hypothetical protein